MRIATWNVNSLKMRLPRIEEFLGYADVDVLCLQETKTADKSFPALAFSTLGYEAVHHSQGQWNGVAILSRVGIEDPSHGFGPEVADPYEGDARVLAATCGGIRFIAVYVPNGREVGTDFYERKLHWLSTMDEWITNQYSPTDPLVVCGDFNVAPADRDVWDPKAFVGSTHVTEPERKAITRACRNGDSRTRSGACIPTRIGSTRTGTIAPATSTSTGACASITSWPRGPSRSG